MSTTVAANVYNMYYIIKHVILYIYIYIVAKPVRWAYRIHIVVYNILYCSAKARARAVGAVTIILTFVFIKRSVFSLFKSAPVVDRSLANRLTFRVQEMTIPRLRVWAIKSNFGEMTTAISVRRYAAGKITENGWSTYNFIICE